MNKVRYTMNWMGPMTEQWYKDRNLELWTYSAGRIDFYNNMEEEPYPDEMAVPPMLREDWFRFSIWLIPVETDFPWTLEQLVELYERENPKITWLKE